MTHPTKLPRGGVDPPIEMLVPQDAVITNAPIPSRALIPLLQHSGKPAVCLVRPGDRVNEGMLIGKADGPGSAHVHASIPGIVSEVRELRLPGGEVCKAVAIELEPNQATCLLKLPNGQLVIGTANAAQLHRLSPRYAAKGTLTSKPLDAGQIVKWGRLTWTAAVPTGTKLAVATRSGNVEDEESESWEEWSTPMDATAPAQVSSAGARFLQAAYR